eukprot:CAMPEP_0202900392 /NCGR_PEP_ID=MMETSP1392-20130828/11443_1 /ASSEMBLY_ACC=CAM_ASM_000868 /TAXON_ID=225041 /ORGANISM="Chlamydomonas chlamydogama, Strain SAG 11-48b" /LENGTH=176 /DNA_ID=CAMNT_0049586773 /DNA_START=127 /DNA_END=657 /DNA_ORIENTATION=+
MSSSRLLSLAGLLRGQSAKGWSYLQNTVTLEATPAGRILGSFLGVNARTLHTSSVLGRGSEPEVAKQGGAVTADGRKYRSLVDKELWHEAWMYEDRFGTENDPIVVPSLEGERIIGVTDPEDDNLVVWGILRESDPPRQFIEGGEFYVLKKVEYVQKVGDVLDAIEATKAAKPLPK